MNKKLLVTIIAIVLVIAVTGSCFALYEVTANQKVINITASADICTLTIGTSTSLDFAGISPSNRTKTVDVTLSTSNNDLVDGVHGIFKVIRGGTLSDYIDITVNAIASVGAEEVGAENTDALTNNGADIALSTVPKYFRITMYLNNAGVAAMATIAESTESITLSWTVDEDSVFSYDANAYYVVGTLNGKTAWYPNADSIVLDDDPTTGNQAMKQNVYLHDGDEFSVVKNYRVSAAWYNAQGSNSAVDGVTGHDGGNIEITADGYYDIYVNTSGQIWVAIHTNP